MGESIELLTKHLEWEYERAKGKLDCIYNHLQDDPLVAIAQHLRNELDNAVRGMFAAAFALQDERRYAPEEGL